MPFYNTEFSITRNVVSINVSITSGEIYAWQAETTQIESISSNDNFIISSPDFENIELVYTQSISPSVTGGSIKNEYINNLIALINDSRTDVPISITSSSAITVENDTNEINGIIGVTQQSPWQVSITGEELEVTGTVPLDELYPITQGALVIRPGSNYQFDVADGLIGNREPISINAYHNTFGTVPEDLWFPGGDYNWLEAAEPLIVESNDVNDDAAGTGAREVTIEGLDASFDEISETVSLVGTTDSAATSNSFIRINKAFVSSCGTYHGSNIGNLDIMGDTSGLMLGRIGALTVYGVGETLNSMYTVPNGKTAYITNIQTSMQSNRRIIFALFAYDNADDIVPPVSGRRLIWQSTFTNVPIFPTFDPYLRIPEKTDLWFRLASDSNTGDAGVIYTLILKDN